MKKYILIFTLIVLVAFSKSHAQEIPNPITTAAPFLLIAPDARAGGMGDIGVGEPNRWQKLSVQSVQHR